MEHARAPDLGMRQQDRKIPSEQIGDFGKRIGIHLDRLQDIVGIIDIARGIRILKPRWGIRWVLGWRESMDR